MVDNASYREAYPNQNHAGTNVSTVPDSGRANTHITNSIGAMKNQNSSPAAKPHPHLPEHLGFTPIHASHRMKPNGGIRNERMNHPQLPVSIGYCGGAYAFAGCTFCVPCPSWRAPQLGQ